jgi:hypothetical protein
MTATAEPTAPAFSPPPAPAEGPLIRYSPTEAEIALLKQDAAGLLADPDCAATPEGYRQVAKVIAATTKARNIVERRRVELKRDALEWGRRVDAEAKRVVGLLLEVEEPLRLAKAKVDDERDRMLQEQEEARLAALEAEQRAKREAEEARWRADRAAEAEANRKEAERIAAERAALEEERRAKLASEEEAAEQRRVDAARPDVEKIRSLGDFLKTILDSTAVPSLSTPEGKLFLAGVVADLGNVVAKCKGYAVTKRTRKAVQP